MKDLSVRLRPSAPNAYLVCDGAVMPDLKRTFESLGFSPLPLFRGQIAPDIINSGPWLIPVETSEETLATALDVARHHEVGVCWMADCEEDRMVSQLRGLNVAVQPDGSLCYFRHYDPDALAWVAEKLDAEQAARLFGPAAAIGFASGFAVGATVEKPMHLPSPKPGPMTFTDAQLEEFESRNRQKSQNEIKNFMRFSFPSELADETDADLTKFLDRQEHSARALGLTSERQIAMWFYLSIATKGKSTGDRLLAEKIRDEY